MHTFDNEPGSSVFIAPLIYTEYHWSAKFVRVVVGFYLRHWQWFLSTTIAVLALYVAVLSLK